MSNVSVFKSWPNSSSFAFLVFTVRKRSCGKVMFLQASVCPQGEQVVDLCHRDPQTETPETEKVWDKQLIECFQNDTVVTELLQ